jgi:hypothetical protein
MSIESRDRDPRQIEAQPQERGVGGRPGAEKDGINQVRFLFY